MQNAGIQLSNVSFGINANAVKEGMKNPEVQLAAPGMQQSAANLKPSAAAAQSGVKLNAMA